MRKSIKALAVASAVVAGLAAAPVLYAHDSEESGGSVMGSGMMTMMDRMSAMMAGCGRMMRPMNRDGASRPGRQGRGGAGPASGQQER